jgi:putative endonuclease
MYNNAGKASMDTWHIYIIRCGDGSLYTGISTAPERRFAEHVRGGPRAARYLKGRGPLRLVFSREAGVRSAALRLERRIKRMSRAGKLALIEDSHRADVLFGDVR